MKSLNLLVALAILVSSQAMIAQKVEVNAEKSNVEWLGKKIGGEHFGTIHLKSGSFELKDDKIVSGEFVMDMTSISNTDVENEEYNQKLVGHLKSDDFFGVEKFPTAKFVVTNSSKFSSGIATLTGNISIKGKTESISFKVQREGNTYAAKFDIDRSKFDVRYGSNSFFDNLGDKAIEDIFTLDIKLAVK